MSALPIDDVLADLKRALVARDEAVLEAPPGAGKTTRVPLALLHEPWLAGQSILLLEPRRLAARAAAERLAQALSEPVGQTVGYRIRLESKVSAATRIEVVTEGILTRRLQEDPSLEGVGLVIFDEFHERSLDADLALALCLNGRALLRDQPLKLLLMSATLDGTAASELLGQAPIISSQGRQYPVELRWGEPYQSAERIEPRLVACVLQALAEESGSLLVFLPGQAHIRRVQALLEEPLDGRADILLCPLYGDMSLAAQRQAIEPAPAGMRKVVLATNIAETSLTIEGVRVVIDAGLAQVPRFDPATGMSRLRLQRISKASATQRAGRAGRLQPGVCYRLWSQAQHEALATHEQAEIVQADLSSLVLQLAGWGASADELSWLDAPPKAALAQAQSLLVRLGALNRQGQLTPHGQLMAGLPTHPRLAHMLIKGRALGQAALAADLAALLSERDILRGADADLYQRWALLSGKQRVAGANQAAVQRVKQLAQQFLRLLDKAQQSSSSETDDEHWLGCLLAFAYPDRVAQQRQAGGLAYRLANGRAASLPEPQALARQQWLVVADLGSRQGEAQERIYLAAALRPELFEHELAELVSEEALLDWDEREGVLRAEQQKRIGELVLAREPLTDLDEATRAQALLGLVRRKGLNMLSWTPALRQWQARVLLLRGLDVAQGRSSEWPDVSDQALLATLDDWLLPYLGKVSRMAHFAALDLAMMLQALLPWPLPQQLETLAPVALQVPSGSHVRIDYSESPPVLAVRLQELFGLAQTPTVAEGRVALKLHLLSPAQRPVQVTQDLASFWRTTYEQVKKDLKGRYPKHYWPDDPLIAEPTARAKPRR